jgi:hypothetical protein
MATITATAAQPTVPGEVRWYPMAASQTFKKGEFLYLNANGQLAVCAASPAGIAGIAMADAVTCVYNTVGMANPVPSGFTATTTNVACPITIAKRGQQFTLNVTTGGSSQVTANSQVAKKYNLYVASNIHYCDIGSATAVFVVDAIAPDNVVGDAYGRVIVEVTRAYAQLDMSTS